jgi:hypothetical protein
MDAVESVGFGASAEGVLSAGVLQDRKKAIQVKRINGLINDKV